MSVTFHVLHGPRPGYLTFRFGFRKGAVERTLLYELPEEVPLREAAAALKAIAEKVTRTAKEVETQDEG